MIRTRSRVVVALLFTLALVASATATFAATAVVPTGYSTIQAAVTAVEGTSGATVEIDSDATFVETVVVHDSVKIVAGAGFAPTIQGDSTPCQVGHCTVTYLPTTSATTLDLEGLRLIPETGATTSDDVLELVNHGSGAAQLMVKDVAIEDPDDDGPTGIQVRLATPNTGTNHLEIDSSSITLAGTPGNTTDGIVMIDNGGIVISNLTMTLSHGDSTGFDLRGIDSAIDFSLDDSTITVNAPAASYSAELGFFLYNVDTDIEFNTFILNSTSQGNASGFFSGTGVSGTYSSHHRFIGNRFLGTGPNTDRAFQAAPFPNETISLIAADNVFSGINAFYFDPQTGTPGGILNATLTNNTIDRALFDGVLLAPTSGTTSTVDVMNNLITNSGQYGIQVLSAGGTLALSNDYNGFFANSAGDLSGLSLGAHSVVGDPIYRNEPAGDLHLGSLPSPMVDAGNNSASQLPAVDADQKPRIYNGTVDIGAYEYVPTVTEIPTLDEKALALLAALLLLSAAWFLKR